MAKHRSLLLGCGPRAVEHADVYRDLPDMELVAVCDRLAERRTSFQERFGVAAAYDEYERALSEVRPDVVHLVTQPTRRVWEAETAAAAGVWTLSRRFLALSPTGGTAKTAVPTTSFRVAMAQPSTRCACRIRPSSRLSRPPARRVFHRDRQTM